MQKNRELKVKFKYTEMQATEEYSRKIKEYSNGLLEVRTYATPIKRIKKGYQEHDKILPFDKQKNDLICYEAQFKLNKQIEDAMKFNDGKEKKIRKDNLTRTRNLIIDYACENVEQWKSFITLTFKENVTDIDFANKQLQNWIRQIKRSEPNFAYLCVPEYQTRGAVHYHMMTNLECGSNLVPKREKKLLFNPSTKVTIELEYYDIGYWKHGYSSAYDLFNGVDEKFNPALYITKYLYKDIDDRFFGHKKVLRSNNLRLPNITYLERESLLYNETLDYIEKKGYSTNDYCPPITNEYQIPCLIQQVQLEQNDISEYALFKIVGDDALL